MSTILITGATSGFGEAIARLFAQHHYELIITGRRKEKLYALQKDLEKTQGSKITALDFDIRDSQAAFAAIRSLENKHIDILVNNAGLAAGLEALDEGSIEDWDAMIDTNVKGLLYMTKACLPLLKKSPHPHIINIGSTAGKMVYQNGNVYCATKFAVDALSQSMRIDFLKHSIKVTAIHPGMAETAFSLVRFKGDKEKAKAVYENIQPLTGRDIADAVWYCTQLPPHVCINDLTITCTQQANSVYTHRTHVE